MLRTAMTDMMTMGDNMPRLAVNVAARSMLDRQFAGAVLSIVNDVGFPPEMLEIEITERAIVTGSERSALTIEQLRARGIRIAIDDFGTGYSSFLTLRDLRADRLKIDRQFTANLLSSQADQLIVTKVIELAHGLGLDVVAEGVESEAVWNRLGTLGCDVAQGYAIARPMSMGDFADWTRKRNAMSSEKLIA
jgi:EAL domain-containing protein (putative c-di-GMP-specific phosphodiesterase class I)